VTAPVQNGKFDWTCAGWDRTNQSREATSLTMFVSAQVSLRFDGDSMIRSDV